MSSYILNAILRNTGLGILTTSLPIFRLSGRRSDSTIVVAQCADKNFLRASWLHGNNVQSCPSNSTSECGKECTDEIAVRIRRDGRIRREPMSVFRLTFSGILFSSRRHQTRTWLARSSSARLVSTVSNCAAPPLLKLAALKS